MKLITCTLCDIDKSREEYYDSKQHKQGYLPGCKLCRTKKSKKQYKTGYHKNRLENLSPEKKLQRIKQLTKRARERRKDPIVRLKESIRTRIYNGLKSDKDRSTEQYLGCNISEYKLYLEPKFTPEMSWDNYGTEWEIDHIKPICSYDLSNENKLYECFHYTNTQPLTIQDNREKSGTF